MAYTTDDPNAPVKPPTAVPASPMSAAKPVNPKLPATPNAGVSPVTAAPIVSTAGGGFNPSMPSATPVPTGITPSGSPLTSTAGDGFGSTAMPTPTPSTGPVSLTPTNPNNPLTGQTIQPGQLADRFALANQKFDQFVQSTDPAYQHALRQANRMGAAGGQLGSGELRTDFGNLGAARANALDVQRQGVFTDALGGSIDDAWKAIGLAERQQGFQNTQQQQAFENELRRLGFDDQMLNSEMGRALQLYIAGQTGGTGSGTMLSGAGSFGAQGQDALEALANLMRNRAAAPTSGTPSLPPLPRPGGPTNNYPGTP